MRILSLSNRFAAMRERISSKFTLPERLKGTFVEKWANYWRGLMLDYSEVAVGVMKESVRKPKKALIIGGTGYGLYTCMLKNPDEDAFYRQLRTWDNRMITVPSGLQNPKSIKYLQELEEAINQKRVRLLSLGICSLLWMDLYDKDDCTYPAICEYTKVGYWNFHERVVDVGFWGRFWRLDYEMINYDINYI